MENSSSNWPNLAGARQSANAAATATRMNPACAKLAPFLNNLATAVMAFMKLSREEMAAPSFAAVLENLDQRFGKRLQLPPTAGILAKPQKIPLSCRVGG
jgi:hypothetical protein